MIDSDSDFIAAWRRQDHAQARDLIKVHRVASFKHAELSPAGPPAGAFPPTSHGYLHYALPSDPPVSILVEVMPGPTAETRLQQCADRNFPVMNAWLTTDTTTWTRIALDSCAETYGPDETDFIFYKTATATYVSLVTNGPACVPAELYVLLPERADAVAYWCGG